MPKDIRGMGPLAEAFGSSTAKTNPRSPRCLRSYIKSPNLTDDPSSAIIISPFTNAIEISHTTASLAGTRIQSLGNLDPTLFQNSSILNPGNSKRLLLSPTP
ncbi:hypothetical protein M7I_3282 [Glarea lozoyensis 74030]|uniref:Uncharacterized protein n=1 Tax=Glarea lozoyensis (strain ATCC 74030 / MF5533) TaxID=1104152 RepID=H0EL46_GLAL7|nr:hypothetical protein M7I_3282 [Glarea lozoyensis 74030]